MHTYAFIYLHKVVHSVHLNLVLFPFQILFVDEPTSGLDAFTAYSIVEQLSKVAHRGCAVLCTIHQPSSETFELFDSVILLKEGMYIYTMANDMYEYV